MSACGCGSAGAVQLLLPRVSHISDDNRQRENNAEHLPRLGSSVNPFHHGNDRWHRAHSVDRSTGHRRSVHGLDVSRVFRRYQPPTLAEPTNQRPPMFVPGRTRPASSVDGLTAEPTISTLDCMSRPIALFSLKRRSSRRRKRCGASGTANCVTHLDARWCLHVIARRSERRPAPHARESLRAACSDARRGRRARKESNCPPTKLVRVGTCRRRASVVAAWRQERCDAPCQLGLRRTQFGRFAGAHELDEGAERAPVDCADAIGVADARLFL